MIVIKRDNPQIFGGKAYLVNSQENMAMNVVADAITVHRGPLTQLLLAHDVQVNQAATNEELLDALTKAFRTNKDFSVAFAKQFATSGKKYSNYGDDSTSMIGEDSEDGNADFWGSGSSSGSSSNNNSGGGMSGAGYLGLINGIVNGVGGILGLFAKPDSTGAQLNYNQQILMLAAQKEAQKKRNQTIAIVSVSALIIGTVIFLVWYAKKNKAL